MRGLTGCVIPVTQTTLLMKQRPMILTIEFSSPLFDDLYVLFVLYSLKNRLGNAYSYSHEKLSLERDLYNEHIFKPVLLTNLDL